MHAFSGVRLTAVFMSVCVLVLPDRRNKASTDEAQPVAKRARQDDNPADKVRIAVSTCLPCACAVELTCLAFDLST